MGPGPGQRPPEYSSPTRVQRRHGQSPDQDQTHPHPIVTQVYQMDPYAAQQVMRDVRTIRNVVIVLLLVAVFAVVALLAIGTDIANEIANIRIG